MNVLKCLYLKSFIRRDKLFFFRNFLVDYLFFGFLYHLLSVFCFIFPIICKRFYKLESSCLYVLSSFVKGIMGGITVFNPCSR